MLLGDFAMQMNNTFTHECKQMNEHAGMVCSRIEANTFNNIPAGMYIRYTFFEMLTFVYFCH